MLCYVCYVFYCTIVHLTLFILFYVHCYAPPDQNKFLVCVNLLGNKPDSDSDSDSDSDVTIANNFLNHELNINTWQ